jgi:hypothetical protein
MMTARRIRVSAALLAVAPWACHPENPSPQPSPAPTPVGYYVEATGSDSSPGTLASPWKTLQHAADVAEPGNVVYVIGTLEEGATLSRSGTPGAPIQFAGRDSQAVISASGLAFSSANSVDYVTIGPLRFVGGSGINVETQAGLLIDGNTFSETERITLVKGSANGTIRNNTGLRGITVDGTSGVTVEGNTIVGGRTAAALGSGDTTSSGVTNLVFRDNVIKDACNHAIWMRGDNIQFYRNLVYDTDPAGSPCNTTQQFNAEKLVNVSMYNNVFYNVVVFGSQNNGACGAACGYDAGNNFRVYNNIFYYDSHNPNGNGYQIFKKISTPGSSSDFNLFYETDGNGKFDCTSGAYPGVVASFAACSGQQANSLGQDPLFVDAFGGDFHLLSGSPAINAGDNAHCADAPADGHCDIGIYEGGGLVP